MKSAVKKTILSVVGPRVAQASRVTNVRALSEHFRLIDLEMDPKHLENLGAMDKVKINTGQWNVRTYTPVLQPHAPGRLRLLVYLHGQSPGALWAASLRAGDKTQLIGIKAALDVGRAPFVLVGDETSLAAALNFQPHADVPGVFEATYPQEVQKLLATLGFRHATVVPRSQDGAHRDALLALVKKHMQALPSPRVVLTGHAQTIQHVGRTLKRAAARPELLTKPHWADNKEGLD